MGFASAPAFELWLTAERAHLHASAESVLHEAAVASLAAGHGLAAVDYATRLLTLNPYDENSHVLLARALRAAGRSDAARRHVERTEEAFRRELGCSPAPPSAWTPS
jgi:DNA-binding SARP family transcriptional activator